MYQIETTISFEAAHRLYGVNTYSKECSDSIHGHSYKVTVYVARSDLNDSGMVIDFKLIKKIIKEIIENKYDHSLILRDIDPLVSVIQTTAPEQKLNIVLDNPTAEWMAQTMYYDLSKAVNSIDQWISIAMVSVQETENNIATYFEGEY